MTWARRLWRVRSSAPRRLHRWLATAPPSVSLVRSLGVLGVAASLFGAITRPLVSATVPEAVVESGLVLTALAGLFLLLLPAGAVRPAVAPLAVIGAIGLGTAFTAVTGGLASPYRAGFVAIVLLVGFFTRPRLAVATAAVGIAGLVAAGGLGAVLAPSDIAMVAATGLLTLMVAISAAQLAAWQRDEERRLRRRVERTRRAVDARRHESRTDQLTGAGNRRGFELRLRRLLLPGSEQRCVLLVADVDGLKLINDTYGHPTGDRVLVTLADALRSLCRHDDEIFRFGGDEFAALFTGTDDDTLPSRFPAQIEARLPEVGEIRASVGVVKREPGDTVESLIRRADERMYEAKHRATPARLRA